MLTSASSIGLICNVYQHTKPGTSIRKFCAASLVHCLQILPTPSIDTISPLLAENRELCEDFLSAVRGLGEVGRDPRVRDCGGDGRCSTCITDPQHARGKSGFWPCYFHTHAPIDVKGKGKAEDGVADKSTNGTAVMARSIEGVVASEEQGHVLSEAGDIMFGKGCYLRLA